VSRPRTFQQRHWSLRDRRGTLIDNPAYAFFPNDLAYWSPTDGAIGPVSPGETRRRARIHPPIPDVWCAMSAAPGCGRILLDVYQPRYDPATASLPTRCCTVDLKTGLAAPVAAAKQAEEADDGKSMVVLDEQSRLQSRSGRSRTYLSSQGERVAAWDCDFGGGATGYLCDSGVTVVGPRKRQSVWTVWPPLLSPEDIMLQPHLHQVWISAEWVFGLGRELLVYNYDGGLLYHAGIPASEVGRPMRPVNALTLRLLARLTPPKPGETAVESRM